MRCCTFLLLLTTLFLSCSKKEKAGEQRDFAKITVDGNTFNFTKLEAVVDTSHDGNTCNVSVIDTVSNSTMIFETEVGTTKNPRGEYRYTGGQFPSPLLDFLHIQTYVNGYAGSYTVQNDAFILTIDKVANGRMHGSLSGKINCYTCTNYFMLVDIKGEFEMPVSYR